MPAMSDLFGYLAEHLEAHPRLRKNFAKSYILLRRYLSPLGIRIPRHTPAGLRKLRKLLSGYDQSRIRSADGPRVLVFSPRGWATSLLIDTLLAQSLKLRGADVLMWNCGKTMPICHITNINEAPPMPCAGCKQLQGQLIADSGIARTTTGQLIGVVDGRQTATSRQILDREVARCTEINGVKLGEIAVDAMNWFCLSAEIPETPEADRMLNEFLLLGETTLRAGKKLFEDFRPDLVVMINGIFTEECVVRNLCTQAAVPYITYERAFGFNSFVFSRNQLANHYDLSSHWQELKNVPLSTEEEDRLDHFLQSWKKGEGAVVKYWDKPEERELHIAQELGIEPDCRIVAMFTNVLWDTAAFNRDIAFTSMWDWISSSIKWAADNSDIHLVVRIHPAEVRLEGRETQDKIADRIDREFAAIPKNVTVIRPENPLSSYRLLALSDVVLVYTSTIGLEAAIAGKRVLVAGETHYRNKGFTLDPADRSEYARLLTDTGGISEPDPGQIALLARRYAHLFFLRYMYRLPMIEERVMGNPVLNIDSIEELLPGSTPELDYLCEFVLSSVGQSESAALISA